MNRIGEVPCLPGRGRERDRRTSNSSQNCGEPRADIRGGACDCIRPVFQKDPSEGVMSTVKSK